MPPHGLKAERTVWTIGHSNHPLEEFLGLLEQHRIKLLVDVRSSPFSRYASQFNREAIQEPLRARAVEYLFLGDLLGGRAEDGQFYDREGYVLYDRLAQSPEFRQGIQRLLKELEQPQPSTLNPQPSTLNAQPSTLNAQPSTLNPQLSTLNAQPSTLNPQPSTLNRRVALMCGEEDPTNCHRRRLVGRVLRGRGVEVMHIRAAGRVQSEEEVAAEETFRKTKGQLTLFDLEEPDAWKSTRSVLPRKAPPSSSESSSEPGSDG